MAAPVGMRPLFEAAFGPIGKTALASGVGWWLARQVVGTEAPYMAALAAILSLNVTVADSVSRGLQRTGGVLAGVALAVLLARIGVPGAVLVGVFVFLAMQLGRRVGLGPLGTPQVAISGLIVWSMGLHKANAYALARLLDTAIGASAAVVINALIRPPDYSRRARGQLVQLATALAGVPEALAEAVRRHDPAGAGRALEAARNLSARVDRVEAAAREARAALRWNPWGGRRRAEVHRLLAAMELLRRHVVQVRVLARTIVDLEAKAPPVPPFQEQLGALLQQTANILKERADTLEPKTTEEPVRPSLEAIEHGLEAVWRVGPPSSSRVALEGLAGLTATIGRIAEDERTFPAWGRGGAPD